MKSVGSYSIKIPRDKSDDQNSGMAFVAAKISVIRSSEANPQKVEWYLSEDYYEGFGLSRSRINELLKKNLPADAAGVYYSAEVEEIGFMGDRFLEFVDDVVLTALKRALNGFS